MIIFFLPDLTGDFTAAGFFSESITAAIGTLFDRDRVTRGGGVAAFFFDRMMVVSMCWKESEQIEYVLASWEIKCVR